GRAQLACASVRADRRALCGWADAALARGPRDPLRARSVAARGRARARALAAEPAHAGIAPQGGVAARDRGGPSDAARRARRARGGRRAREAEARKGKAMKPQDHEPTLSDTDLESLLVRRLPYPRRERIIETVLAEVEYEGRPARPSRSRWRLQWLVGA